MEHRHTRYLELLQTAPIPRADWRKGEVEHVPEPERFLALEARLIERYRHVGKPEGFGYVGLIHEDEWYVIVRDPVLFPSGTGRQPLEGAHIRVLYRGDAFGQQSLFVLARLPDKKLLLNLSYRRPAGCWKLEGMGRITREGETLDSALKRCVSLETGAQILNVTPLGSAAFDRGLIGPTVPLFLVDIDTPGSTHTDPTITGHMIMSPDELDRAFLEGVCVLSGRAYVCNDAPTMAALYQARLRGLV